jgi:hypothetical protein
MCQLTAHIVKARFARRDCLKDVSMLELGQKVEHRRFELKTAGLRP